ncbi:MAG: ATP-dependent helicase [Frankia sp.]
MFDPAWDEGLDERQLAAATHGDGPLVILAGAGTGKTRTLVARVANLVDRGVDPGRILLLTFTRRAADEMLARAAAVCGNRGAGRRLWGGTFHAVAHRLVSAHAEALGLPPALSVLDASDARDLLDLLRHDHGLGGTAERFPRAETLLDIYSRAVNTARPARAVIATAFPWCEPHTAAILDLFRAYMAGKRAQGVLDFDDLLLAWQSLLADPIHGGPLAARWDHVLVDEYQDVNAAQVEIVRLLCPDGRGLTVVGDDGQAIYGFRGADSRHLGDVARTVPGTRVIRLERNFRARQPLLDLANAVRPRVDSEGLTLRSDRTGGPPARLVRCHDVPAEARLVVDAVLGAAQDGRRLRDQAVLMRSSHHSDVLEVELTARGVPFVKYGGLKFLEAAHVKDFVAGLRLLQNRRDEVAWFRLLRLHDGIGPARARLLLDVLTPNDRTHQRGADGHHDGRGDQDESGDETGTGRYGEAGDHGGNDGERHAEAVAAAPPATRTALATTLAALLQARDRAPVAARAAAVLEMVRPLVVGRYVDHPARLTDLDRLVGAAGSAASLNDFAAQVTLDPPASTSDLAGPPHLDDDYLVLSTVHSAKGLEWESVHLIHVVDGAFPSDMALTSPTGLAEEQRLFYVAATRAREELALYTPLRMPHHRRARDDRHSYAPASRFLTDEAVATLDVHEAVAPAPAVRPTGTAPVALPTLDDLWA